MFFPTEFVACCSSFQQKREAKAWLNSASKGPASGEWVPVRLRGATGQQEQDEGLQL